MAGAAVQIKAKDVVEDLRAGLNDDALMSKYQISAKQLQRLFQKLVDGGFLEQTELNARAEHLARSKPEIQEEPCILGAADANKEDAIRAENPINNEGTKEPVEHPSDVRRRAARMVTNFIKWLTGQLSDIVKGAQMLVQRLRTEGAGRVFSRQPDAPLMSLSEKKSWASLLGGLVLGSLVTILVVVGMGLLGGRGGEAKPVISKQEYSVVRQSSSRYVVIAKGAVKNVGSKDAKKVLITADCDCTAKVVTFLWVDASVALEGGKGTMIDYLAAGDKETFEFQVAVMVNSSYSDIFKRNPDPPKKLETRVVSFETVK